MYYTLIGWFVNHTLILASIYILFICLIALEILDEVKPISSYSIELAKVLLVQSQS